VSLSDRLGAGAQRQRAVNCVSNWNRREIPAGARTTFKTAAFNRSATSPRQRIVAFPLATAEFARSRTTGIASDLLNRRRFQGDAPDCWRSHQIRL
jgi:hypothetical protein